VAKFPELFEEQKFGNVKYFAMKPKWLENMPEEQRPFAPFVAIMDGYVFIGGSTQPAQDIWDCVLGTGQFTGNFNSHYEHILQPNVFMNGLRTGGKLNGHVCDAVVIRSGEPFSNGQNFLQVAFSQR